MIDGMLLQTPYLHFVAELTRAFPTRPIILLEARHVSVCLSWRAHSTDAMADAAVQILQRCAPLAHVVCMVSIFFRCRFSWPACFPQTCLASPLSCTLEACVGKKGLCVVRRGSNISAVCERARRVCEQNLLRMQARFQPGGMDWAQLRHLCAEPRHPAP